VSAFKLGVFMPNLGGGMSVTSAPRDTSPSLAYNRRVAQLAERLGFDFVLPAARWKGTGGELDAQGEGMDCFTWAAAMALATERIAVWSTVHAHLVHPVLCAKIGASLQEISGGRWGMNVVTGWNRPEMELFGVTHTPPEQRHALVTEWLDIVLRLWSDQDFDYIGDHYEIRGGYLKPKPEVRPTLMNAGVSAASRELTARYMDYYFVNTDSPDKLAAAAVDVRERAAAHGRSARVCSTAFVLVRDTQREAERALGEIVDGADLVCVDNILRLINLDVRAYSDWEREQLERRLIVGSFAPIYVGTPETVAGAIADVAATGTDGLMLEWFDYEREMAYFGETVMPLLERTGLR
jgi:FMNH2-dependent dimethyl sulfone monooxygenase